jgi:hypothetical protein
MAQQTRIFRRPVIRSARVRQVWYRLRRPFGLPETVSRKR